MLWLFLIRVKFEVLRYNVNLRDELGCEQGPWGSRGSRRVGDLYVVVWCKVGNGVRREGVV